MSGKREPKTYEEIVRVLKSAECSNEEIQLYFKQPDILFILLGGLKHLWPSSESPSTHEG